MTFYKVIYQMNFSVSTRIILEKLASMVVKRARRSDGIQSVFYRILYKSMTAPLNKIFRSVERKRKLPESWKIDEDVTTHIIAFYTDFSRAFDGVHHPKLLNQLGGIGVGICLLEVLFNYLRNQKAVCASRQD